MSKGETGTWATYDADRDEWKCVSCGKWIVTAENLVRLLRHDEACWCGWTSKNNLNTPTNARSHA